MKEFIEIPFGAKDSELRGWEYTIPEGFVASIENGKIIVTRNERRIIYEMASNSYNCMVIMLHCMENIFIFNINRDYI